MGTCKKKNRSWLETSPIDQLLDNLDKVKKKKMHYNHYSQKAMSSFI